MTKLTLLFWGVLSFIVLIGCGASDNKVKSKSGVEYSEDSIKHLEPDVNRVIKYYASGAVKQIGLLDGAGNKTRAWREYNEKGEIIGVSYYVSNKLSNRKGIDVNDFLFKEISIDSFFSIQIPHSWKEVKTEEAKFAVVKEHSNDSFYNPNIIVLKVPIERFTPENKKELEDVIINSMRSKCKANKILDAHWNKKNVFSLGYLCEVNDKLIGNYDFYFIRDGYLYQVLTSAYSGKEGNFVNYIDVFTEILYTMKYKNEYVF